MSDDAHPDRAELERYVTGDLDSERTQTLEAHVERCEGCARALAGEARVEVALRSVARLEPPAASFSRMPRLVRRAMPALGAMAVIAAGVALVVVFGRPVAAPFGGQMGDEAEAASIDGAPVIDCGATRGADRQRCRQQARCAGRLIEGGTGAHEVPRYEVALAECGRAPGLTSLDREKAGSTARRKQ